MNNEAYIDLLIKARKRAKKEYVLAKTFEEKLQWSAMSSRLLEKIYTVRTR